MMTTKSKSGIPTRAEKEMSARVEALIWKHIDVARQIASHLPITQKDARESFFTDDHKSCVEYHQKWPKWTDVWQLSLVQMYAIIQKSEGKRQRLQRKEYEKELLRRLSVAGTYDVIAPDSNGDRRRWCVALAVYFYWDAPEKLVPLLQQRVNRDKADLGLTNYLYFLAPPSREARERAERKRKAEEARQLELARQRAKAEKERIKKERAEKAATRFHEVISGDIKLKPAQKEASEPLAADVDELEGMLDPFAAFDLSSLKGDQND